MNRPTAHRRRSFRGIDADLSRETRSSPGSTATHWRRVSVLRRCVNNCGNRSGGGRGGHGRGRHVLASRADAEDFEVVTVDGEVRVAREIAQEVVEGATGEGDDGAALGADQVVAVPRLTDDVGGVTAGLEEASQEIDRGEDLQRAVDGGATDRGEFLDDLLGGERSPVGENGIDNRAARAGQPVAVIVEDIHHMVGGRDLWRVRQGCRVHGDEA